MTTELATRPLLEEGVTADAVGFLRSMLNRRPEQRATVRDLMSHPWMGGRRPRPDDEESMDEVVEDDDLNVGASQLSIQDGQSRPAPQSQQFDDVMDAVLDEFDDDDSQKENSNSGTFGQQGKNVNAPRLWGEVNISAVGSSGVIPEDRLNISLPGDRPGHEDSMETEIRDSVDSRTPSTRKSNSVVDLFASVANGQSADQLQSLVYNVQSQSLGGSESVIQDVQMQSVGGPSVEGSYFTTSKRKPAHDTSDEFENPPKHKPTFKRLRSEGNMEALANQATEELHLLASMPLVKRLESGRQIDGPHDKMVFWVNHDLKTWHQQYPEMTETQLRAFEKAAEARKEQFKPGQSSLWDLAMKFFPPTQATPSVLPDTEHPIGRLGSPEATRGLLRDPRNLTEIASVDVPSTALPNATDELDSLPDTLPPDVTTPPDINSFLGVEEQQLFAVLESAFDSSLSGINIPIRDTLVSWGRAPENTNVYANVYERKVPKFGLRVVLWKEGYDPMRKPSHKNGRPWERAGTESDYHFYLSTRATSGVHVNDMHLGSNRSRPQAPHNWTRLHDGDEIVVWGGLDSPDKMKLIFRCFWGGSALSRQGGMAIMPTPQAMQIEESFVRTERRVKVDQERQRRVDAAAADMRARRGRIDLERERTRLFEQKILEARTYLAEAKPSP